MILVINQLFFIENDYNYQIIDKIRPFVNGMEIKCLIKGLIWITLANASNKIWSIDP